MAGGNNTKLPREATLKGLQSLAGDEESPRDVIIGASLPVSSDEYPAKLESSDATKNDTSNLNALTISAVASSSSSLPLIDRLYNEVSFNKDGTVDDDEIDRAMVRTMQKNLSASSLSVPSAESLINEANFNDDGTLSADEMDQILARRSLPRLQRIFNEANFNDDGTLDDDEMDRVLAMTKAPPLSAVAPSSSSRPKVQRKANSNLFNKDGTLDDDEMNRRVSRMMQKNLSRTTAGFDNSFKGVNSNIDTLRRDLREALDRIEREQRAGDPEALERMDARLKSMEAKLKASDEKRRAAEAKVKAFDEKRRAAEAKALAATEALAELTKKLALDTRNMISSPGEVTTKGGATGSQPKHSSETKGTAQTKKKNRKPRPIIRSPPL